MAGQFYEYATAISPRNTERQLLLAKLFLETGNMDGAQSALHRSLEGEESVGARSAAAAEFFLSSGHPDMAEKEYAFAIEMNPENLNYYNRLGIAFRQQKKWKEAMDVYKKALKASPKNTIIFYNMARCLAEEGKFTQAGTALRHALGINPKFKEAKNFLDQLNKRAMTAA